MHQINDVANKYYIADAPAKNITKIVYLDFNVSPEIIHYYRSSLSTKESLKLESIKLKSRRDQFIITRAITRKIIADSINCPQNEIDFGIQQYGKPYCSTPNIGLHFNLSHSLDVGVIAINLTQEIGIDVQQHRPQQRIIKMAQRFFSDSEIQLIEQLPEADLERAFFHIWVRKEALLKATGTGFTQGLSRYAVVSDQLKSSQCYLQCDNNDYYIHDIPAPPHYSSAVASKQLNCKFTVCDWRHPEVGH
ncbi:hypothetical protein MNBD_GAMMA12-3642 [hydrothermal vent metagenome]|uniref:Uncharacterized protein n=1 Tax=hydrothermal vent metagenome TaxID=652676 RepID=A0A3B0Y994_9ZZZZ